VQEPAEVVRQFMVAFVAAWPTGDASSLARFFSRDAVYCNGPLPPVVGRDGIIATLASFMAMGGAAAVEVRYLLADGPIVMTERIDHVTRGGRRLSLPLMGICEVHEGVITAWRDYFDLDHFTAQLPRES
jgi:limonene-1,2-epoxide hydrolase